MHFFKETLESFSDAYRDEPIIKDSIIEDLYEFKKLSFKIEPFTIKFDNSMLKSFKCESFMPIPFIEKKSEFKVKSGSEVYIRVFRSSNDKINISNDDYEINCSLDCGNKYGYEINVSKI